MENVQEEVKLIGEGDQLLSCESFRLMTFSSNEPKVLRK